jgi:hypothetical protein
MRLSVLAEWRCIVIFGELVSRLPATLAMHLDPAHTGSVGGKVVGALLCIVPCWHAQQIKFDILPGAIVLLCRYGPDR